MKRNKHILINLTEDQYSAIALMSDKNRRKIADMVYILVSDAIDEKIINYIDEKNSGFKKLEFNN